MARYGKQEWDNVDGFLHFPANAQITLSSVTFCLSENKVDCCHAPYNETVSLPFTVFCDSKSCL